MNLPVKSIISLVTCVLCNSCGNNRPEVKNNRDNKDSSDLIVKVDTTIDENKKIALKNLFNKATKVNRLEIPKLQAHRGMFLHTDLKENTIGAFKEAKKNGFKMVETDMQLTKDGEIVLYHNHNLEHDHKIDLDISDLTLAEFKNFTNGSTLREVLEDKSIGDLLINIESKYYETSLNLEEKFAELIKEFNAENRFLFSSFNIDSLVRMKEINPRIQRQVLFSLRKEDSLELRMETVKSKTSKADTKYVSINSDVFNIKFVEELRREQFQFSIWTVNDYNLYLKLLEFQPVSIITDVNFFKHLES